VRQRVFHKFDYGRKNFGLPFCVGCGRCIEACPVHNDLRVILERAEAAAEETAEAGVPPGAGAERGK
jgi:ferredoxin